jgi:hypothetical protein
VLPFALTLFVMGAMPNSLQIIGHNYAHSLLQLGLCQSQPADDLTQLCLCQVVIGLSYSALHSTELPELSGTQFTAPGVPDAGSEV